jgi:hypothetical protein
MTMFGRKKNTIEMMLWRFKELDAKTEKKKKKKTIYAKLDPVVHTRCLGMKGPPIWIKRYRGNYYLAIKRLLMCSLNSAVTPYNLESAMNLPTSFFK